MHRRAVSSLRRLERRCLGLRRSDLEVIHLAAQNGNIFTEYYFAGFQFQDWQLLMHHAAQPNIQTIGGVGSSETISPTEAMSSSSIHSTRTAPPCRSSRPFQNALSIF